MQNYCRYLWCLLQKCSLLAVGSWRCSGCHWVGIHVLTVTTAPPLNSFPLAPCVPLQARIQELADTALQQEREDIIHRLAEELASVHAAQSSLEQETQRWKAEAGLAVVLSRVCRARRPWVPPRTEPHTRNRTHTASISVHCTVQ